MNEEARAKLEAWLHYYEDLGLDSFYRDRVPQPLTGEEAAAASSMEAEAGSTALQPAEQPSAGATRSATTQRSLQPSSSGQPAPLPILQVPSLFDSVERVEGDTLERIREDIGECTRCRLHKQRTHIVFGVGNAKAELVFVGEGPGHDEDVQGIPFVGRAGRLLTQMIEAMGLQRDDVYICNVVKCRPPENRTPERDEIATCSPFLLRQLAVIHPKVIVCLGNVAAQTLLGSNKSMAHLRGQWFDYRGSRLIATYHPAYLLRNPDAKGEVWKDLKKVMAILGLKPKRILR